MQCLLLPGGGSVEVDALSPRSSSRSLVPMRRLNTIQESGSSAAPHLPSGEQVGGPSGGFGVAGGSSLRGHRKAPLPAPKSRGTQPDTDEGAEPDTGSPLLGPSSQEDTGTQ